MKLFAFMTITRGAQRMLIAALATTLLGIYAIAWMAPGIGLFNEDAAYLVAARSLAAGRGAQTNDPPLFPLLLALFTLVSEQTQWLKLLPLACTFGWLALTWKLLCKMGASNPGALLLVAMTAASPTVVFNGTNLLSEPLFALLLTAALLFLLQDRPVAAGVFAGLATLTEPMGVALIATCIVTLATRRRFRQAILFTAPAIMLAAPWFGWVLAQTNQGSYYRLNILTSLNANEKLVVLANNMLFLLQSPFALMTGIVSMYAVAATVALFIWALVRRRHLLPDLFLAIYCLILLCWASPPQRAIGPVLPLVLWILWRAFHNLRIHEALAACIVILLVLALATDFGRLPATRRLGQFATSNAPPSDWRQMQRVFGYIREKTPADAVIMANLDSAFYLNTGRKTIRGFTPDNYRLFYGPPRPVATPDGLSSAIMTAGVGYVALTPDRDFAEAPAYRHAVEALERGGMLEPVSVPGLSRDYRLLRTVSFSLRR
jgi:hypothetical protein